MPTLTPPLQRQPSEATRPARKRKDADVPASTEKGIVPLRFQSNNLVLRPGAQITALMDWLAMVRVDRFDLAIIRFSHIRPNGQFIPGLTDQTRWGVEGSIGWLRYENSREAGVYFRPARGHAWPLVFLDDVTPKEAHRIADSYSAALIETSPDRFHVWLATDKSLTEIKRYQAQVDLAKQVGADLGSVSGEHWGRLPGFKNRKPGKDGWVNLRRCSLGQMFRVTPGPSDARISVTESECVPMQMLSEDSEKDESAVEWKFVRSALEAGQSPSIVHRQLLEHCFLRRGPDAKRYAEKTMRKACAKGGIKYP